MMARAMREFGRVRAHLKFDQLRPGQDRTIYSLFGQHDTICVLPTGYGKSLCYIVPTLCHQWKCLIFSPLVSLMQDQVESLWRMDLAAQQVSSGQTPAENHAALASWENGDLQFLLVAPERMDNEAFMRAMRRVRPQLVVVDEAHCLSRWGTSFRPSYVQIGDFVEQLKPDAVLALTATATPMVLQDIRQLLGLQNANQVLFSPKRENLKLETEDWQSEKRLLKCLNEIPGPAIVYCATQKRTEELFYGLSRNITGGALVYHGGLDKDTRTTNQALFMRNEARVVFATNAFGMGINKSDIRGIIHRDVPRALEDYAQEIGRGGRDGQDTRCMLFVAGDAFATAQWFIDSEFPPRDTIETVFFWLNRVKDKSGCVQCTLEDMAAALHLRNSKGVASAVSILTRFKVVERDKEEERPVKIVLLKEHPDAKYQFYMDQVRMLGFYNGREHEVAPAKFVERAKVKWPTLLKKLKELEQNHYLTYTLPYRGSTTRVVGDLSLVDFEDLDIRRRDAVKKLDAMRRFVDIPDAQKQDFLVEYFRMGAA
jgi:ATP-dependent DNA helicase RecQ